LTSSPHQFPQNAPEHAISKEKFHFYGAGAIIARPTHPN